MKETNVARTRIYGKKPHDVYTVKIGDDTVQLLRPALEELGEKLGERGIEPSGINEVIADLEQVGGLTFEESEKLAFAREMLKRTVVSYDHSADVNGLTIKHKKGETVTWLDAETRNHLVTGITTWSATHEDYTLDIRDAGTAFTLPCNTLLEWLGLIENYAVSCFNTTSAHLRNVAGASMEELVGYDYKAGYPNKLTFDTEER